MKRLFFLLLAGALIGVLSVGAQDYPPGSRGYLTTPQELRLIAEKASQGLEPYRSAVDETLHWADRLWESEVDTETTCGGSANRPRWIDESRVGIMYAKALAFHLTGDERYAAEVKAIIERIVASVETITIEQPQCRLNFSWGIPEFVASADLIEDYWRELTCYGPASTRYGDTAMTTDRCKVVFQNWLVKNPYYVLSHSALGQSNWGAAATNASAYIADYLWDRPEVTLMHRHPSAVNGGADLALSPAAAYAYAVELLFIRLNGYGVDYDSSSACDFIDGRQQDDRYPPVKSQITEQGIIPDDARREEDCNIPVYNGHYQNYPQVNLNNTLQQCELMLRRGDSSCYDNIALDDRPEYRFVGPDGEEKVTHLRPGRGSVERAINAIIVDSDTEWRHDTGLYLALRYYFDHSRFGLVSEWYEELDREAYCSQGVCFGKLTHGFSPNETPALPPTVAPPQNR